MKKLLLLLLLGLYSCEDTRCNFVCYSVETHEVQRYQDIGLEHYSMVTHKRYNRNDKVDFSSNDDSIIETIDSCYFLRK